MDDDTLKAIGIGAVILVTLTLIGYVLFSPKTYTMKVKVITWDYGVHIEEFKVVHHTNERSKPKDAYNVQRHTKVKTKTVTDADGNTTIKTETYVEYDYDVNRWVETRCVTTSGRDHEPYFGEYTLKESDRTDGIGNERVGHRSKEYTASGTLVNSEDEELHHVSISERIWDELTTNDELNYLKSRVGDPYEVRIAK